MKAYFLENRANFLAGYSKKVFKLKQKVIKQRKSEELYSNPIIYLIETMFREEITEHHNKLLEITNYLKDHEIIEQEIKKIQFDQVHPVKIPNQLGNLCGILSVYPKKRKIKQIKQFYLKKLYLHLIDIMNYYVNFCNLKNIHNNKKKLTQEGDNNDFLDQVEQQQQKGNEKQFSNGLLIKSTLKIQEKVISSLKECLKKHIQVFRCQMLKSKVRKIVDWKHWQIKKYSTVILVGKLKNAIQKLCLFTQKVELSKVFTKGKLGEINEYECQVLIQNHKNFKKETFELEIASMFKNVLEVAMKAIEQKSEQEYKIRLEKSSNKTKGVHSKIILKKNEYIHGAFCSQKFKKSKQQIYKLLQEQSTSELDIQKNLESQLLNVSCSQVQKRDLKNLLLKYQTAKENKQFNQILSNKQKQTQLRSKNQINNKIQVNYDSKQNPLYRIQGDKLLGGGICGSKLKVGTLNTVMKKQQQIKQIIDGKDNLKKEFEIQSEEEKLKAEQILFQKFNKSYSEYFTTQEVHESQIETDVRQIIQNVLFEYRDQIVWPQIRHKVIDVVNLLINYLLIIQQTNSKSSIQSDINQISNYLQILITYCKENKEKFPCLDLYQYFDILKTLNSQRIGLDIVNQSIATQIVKNIIQVVKFGAGFLSIAGAIQNFANFDLNKVNDFINKIKQIVQQITSESSTAAIQQGLDVYLDYNTNNIANNIQSLWLKKVNYFLKMNEQQISQEKSVGESIFKNDSILEIVFYLEESPEITNKDAQLFVYMQLNYLLSKQQMEDNFDQLTKRLDQLKKRELIILLSKTLQVEEYSDGIIDKIKNIANLIAQSSQFRYVKAQLLLYFAQILKLSHKNDFTEIMTGIVSNYIQEKQQSVKIIYKSNQIMADFIHNHLDKDQILAQINKFKRQITKHLDDKQQYNDFAYDIQNEKDLDKQLSKYFVEMWEQSVKQRQKKLELTHKDDALLEAIHLYVNQQITYQAGLKFRSEENDAVKLIIDQFLVPNYVFSSDEIQYHQSSCKIISILAEGGSGKSMLLKKLEVELLNRDSNYTEDNRSDFIPFIIKCNSLDKERPSIEDYLESVNIKRKDIDLLKKSERNKLVMIDGYDEFSGDYFKVYEKLKLNEWVNTLVIATSRLEKITVSDAKVYFNYYDNQGNQGESNSFSIFKLEKMTEADIEKYLEKYKQQAESQKINFNSQQHDKLKEIIFKNKQLTELLKLPINMYLTTKMIADIDLSDENVSQAFGEVSDQIDIQELFFSQQFNKQSQIFVEQFNDQNLDQMQRLMFIQKVQACYFEYFQSIAMHMFIQKGNKSNYLSTTRDSIKYQPREEVCTILKKNKIKVEDLIKKLNSFVDSRVITRIQLKLDTENSKGSNENQKADEQQFEFRHKSIFEYFAARAMKYDFDLHKEDIFKLEISNLKQFSVNQRIIMSSEQNASEQQILIKFYKLIKPYIDSNHFHQTYSIEEVSKTNRYIQFLKKSTITKYTEKSQIDIGASNLLSALFLSNFLYPQLIFKKCSFSQAYISSKFSKNTTFQECNFSESLIQGQDQKNYETSNTQNAIFNGIQKEFDIQDTYSFEQVIFYKNTLVSTTKTGYINQFEILCNDDYQFKLLKQKKITSACLKRIYLIDQKNIFVATMVMSLFEIDAQNFEIINSFSFNSEINSFAIKDQKYLIALTSNEIFYGDIQNGFTLLDKNKIQGQHAIAIKDFFVISDYQEGVNIFNSQNLQLIKKMYDQPSDLNLSAFSQDFKYFVAIQEDDCQILDIEKGFELIKTTELCGRFIRSVSFSADGKYLILQHEYGLDILNQENIFSTQTTIYIGDKNTVYSTSYSIEGKYLAVVYQASCQIYDIENQFKHIVSISAHMNQINSVAYSADGKYFATGSGDKTCKIWSVEKGYQLLKNIEGHKEQIYQIAFSADGRYLATACCYYFKIWNIEKGFLHINLIIKYQEYIKQFAFSFDSQYLATVDGDNFCRVREIEKGFQIMDTFQQNEKIVQLAFSPDNKYLVTVSKIQTCEIWDIKNGFKFIKNLFQLKDSVNQIVFSSDFKYLVIVTDLNGCQIWDLANKFQFIKNLENLNHQPAFAFSPNCKYLAGSNRSLCQIWNVDKGFQLTQSFESGDIFILTFSIDSKCLSIGYRDGIFIVWNIEKGFEKITSLVSNILTEMTSVSFSSNCKLMVTCSYFEVTIWNIEKGFDIINIIKDPTSGFRYSIFSPDNKYFFTVQYNDKCNFWSIENGLQLMETVFYDIRYAAFSSDGKYLAISTIQGNINILNKETGFKHQTTIENTYFGQFSPNSKHLVTIDDQIVEIWNIENNFSIIKKINGHENIIQLLTFSPDGKYMAIYFKNYICKIWNAKNEYEFLYEIFTEEILIHEIQFSACSRYFVMVQFLKNSYFILDVEKEFETIANLKLNLPEYKHIKSFVFSADGKYLAFLLSINVNIILDAQKLFEKIKYSIKDDKISSQTSQIKKIKNKVKLMRTDQFVKESYITCQYYDE